MHSLTIQWIVDTATRGTGLSVTDCQRLRRSARDMAPKAASSVSRSLSWFRRLLAPGGAGSMDGIADLIAMNAPLDGERFSHHPEPGARRVREHGQALRISVGTAATQDDWLALVQRNEGLGRGFYATDDRNWTEGSITCCSLTPPYILTHPEYAPLFEERFAAIRRAVGASAQPRYRDPQWLLDASRNPAYAG